MNNFLCARAQPRASVFLQAEVLKRLNLIETLHECADSFVWNEAKEEAAEEAMVIFSLYTRYMEAYNGTVAHRLQMEKVSVQLGNALKTFEELMGLE